MRLARVGVAVEASGRAHVGRVELRENGEIVGQRVVELRFVYLRGSTVAAAAAAGAEYACRDTVKPNW